MSDLMNVNYCLKEIWSKLAWICLIKYTGWMTIFDNISSFYVPNFFWIFNQYLNLMADSCRGVIGIRLNEYQLLFKRYMVQASMDLFNKIYSLGDYL